MNMIQKAALYLTLAGLSMLAATQTLAQCGNPLPNGHIYLVVPSQGGAVESQSNTHNCPAGQTCDFIVPGAAGFSDTFTAKPAIGYRFMGWKNAGTTSLCPGATGPCNVNLGSTWTTTNGVGHLEPIFKAIEALDLLPDTTRGAFRIHPQEVGAIDTTITTAPWSMGVLPLLDKYSAGMDVAGAAGYMVLAQLDDSAEFLLVAELTTTDVADLSSSVSLTPITDYQQYPLWIIQETGGLELAQISDQLLVIGSHAALVKALDSAAGASGTIEQGALSSNLGPLKSVSSPNGFVYGLPALYGEVTSPGNGDFSLNQAEAVFGSFNTNDGSGLLLFETDNAAQFSTKLLAELSDTPPPVFSVNRLVVVNLANVSFEDAIRPLLKTLILEMDAVDYTAAVVHGGNPPFLNFNVGGSPNSIFINFEFKDQTAREDFEADHLPPGITLAPIRILAGEAPRYFLVLNIYNSSGGLVEGARAEWSVFINDPLTDEPRFTVIQAAAAAVSADPVNLLTQPEPVTHELNIVPDPDTIDSYVGVIDPDTQVETEYFSSSINWPDPPVASNTGLAREFVVANDYIFWGNLVADRGLYNSTFHSRKVVLIDANEFSVTDNSRWKDYVFAAPVHALVYQNPLDLVVSPWWNLDEAYLAVTPAHRAALIGFKNGFYPNLVQTEAKAAMRGEKAVLTPMSIGDSVPTARYHFPLQNPTGLLAAVDADRTPVAVKLFEDDTTPEYYVTLSVYRREKDPCGIRAEWTTYVETPDGRPTTLRLDAFAAESCLNPVTLLTVATDLTQSIANGFLNTQFVSPFTRFEATVDLNLADAPLLAQEWIEAGDRVCSLNGICDDFYYDGELLMAPATRVVSPGVQIQEIATPWNSYIDTNTARVDVRNSPALQAHKPWRNVRSFAADAPAP